jgi:hypothetical protein
MVIASTAQERASRLPFIGSIPAQRASHKVLNDNVLDHVNPEIGVNIITAKFGLCGGLEQQKAGLAAR